ATGFSTLFNNVTGNRNTGVGYRTLLFNNANDNTAIGWNALYNNHGGVQNTAIGNSALYSNTEGHDNMANGVHALDNNTTGCGNTANGVDALLNNTTGENNTAIGSSAGALVTGSGNVCIGSGVTGVAGVDQTTWIRNVYASVAGDRPVYVNADNKIGTPFSSRRYKHEIRPMA